MFKNLWLTRTYHILTKFTWHSKVSVIQGQSTVSITFLPLSRHKPSILDRVAPQLPYPSTMPDSLHQLSALFIRKAYLKFSFFLKLKTLILSFWNLYVLIIWHSFVIIHCIIYAFMNSSCALKFPEGRHCLSHFLYP